MEIVRTEFRNSGGSVRGGDMSHGESLNDIENYQMLLDRVRGRAMFSGGVVEGLVASAQAGQPGVRVTPGSALDPNGNLVVLAVDGPAVTDPDVDPDDLENIPTVLVDATGVTATTTGRAGDCVLTLTWREVAGQTGTFVRRHAPWVRVRPATEVVASSEEIPLAGVTLDDAGNVLALGLEARRQAGVSTGRLLLNCVRQSLSGDVGQRGAAELSVADVGDVTLTLLADGQPPRAALRVSGTNGELALTGGLRLVDPQGMGADFTLRNDEGIWRLSDVATGQDRLLVDSAGQVGIGLDAQEVPVRPLHVEGGEIHSGGGGGYSFADRKVSSFVPTPNHGERWVWYAEDEMAHLWSGTDRLIVDAGGNVGINVPPGQVLKRSLYVSGGAGGVHTEGSNAGFSFADRGSPLGYVDQPGSGERWVWYASSSAARLWSGRDRMIYGANDRNLGLDVFRRMRIRQDGSDSAGMWFFQDGPQADRGFVGMKSDTEIGLYGNTGSGWGLWIDTTTGFVNFRDSFGQPNGPTTLRLFQSEIGDRGGGTLFIRSGGGIVDFNGGDTVVFRGPVSIAGPLSKPGGQFKIDHPLDPLGAYLAHSFVESPDRLNVYVGTVVTDDLGAATIDLPAYFEALNRDHRVQLTPVGALARVAVRPTIKDNCIEIISDEPGLEVAWQVTGVRQDAWAERHPMLVEERKSDDDQGRYLHPEVFGQPLSRAVRGPAARVAVPPGSVPDEESSR